MTSLGLPRSASPWWRWARPPLPPRGVTRPHAALARNGSLVAWTRKLGSTNTSYRVQTATP